MEIRFSFHPQENVLLIARDYLSHGESIRKEGLGRPFDSWIRGIIFDNRLYLRAFYPLPDIDSRTGQEITDKSFSLLFDARKAIIKALKGQGIKIPSKVIYNVTNDDLRGIIVNI